MADAHAEVPGYVEARIRRPPPEDCRVVVGSTPVVAFGDPRRSRVATLGLNPSRIEFEVKESNSMGPKTVRDGPLAHGRAAHRRAPRRRRARLAALQQLLPRQPVPLVQPPGGNGQRRQRLLLRRHRLPPRPEPMGDRPDLEQAQQTHSGAARCRGRRVPYRPAPLQADLPAAPQRAIRHQRVQERARRATTRRRRSRQQRHGHRPDLHGPDRERQRHRVEHQPPIVVRRHPRTACEARRQTGRDRLRVTESGRCDPS